jgi:CRP-like cAMP-binding protein
MSQLTPGLQNLQTFISGMASLSANEWQRFSGIWQPFEAKRKTLLTTAGETEKYLYFVTEGVQRAFYLHSNDKEATLVFTYPFSFSGVADSFLTQTPSRYYFETLTTSRFLRTSHTQLQQVMNEHRAIEKLVLKLVSFVLTGVLERQIELQCFTAEEKFKALLRRSPHVLQLIPHKYLASYLAIDATTFSKLLGTVRL